MEENNLGSVEQTITEPVINNEKKRLSIGWLILGLFFPLVGLILFFVFKNKNKRASKGAGLGALIGFGLEVILTVVSMIVLFNMPLSDYKAVDVKAKKYSDGESLLSERYKYRYIVDWNDKYSDISQYNVLSPDGKKLFKIEEPLNNGVSIILKNEDIKLQFDEYWSDVTVYNRYIFYYTDNLLLFSTGEDDTRFYFYDMSNNKLYDVFDNKNKGDEHLRVSDFVINEDGSITFNVSMNKYIETYDNKIKVEFYENVQNKKYATTQELESALKSKFIDDFVVSEKITFSKEGKNYSTTPTIKKVTLKDYLDEQNGVVTEEVSIKDIDVSKPLDKYSFTEETLEAVVVGKEYDLAGSKLLLKDKIITLKSEGNFNDVELKNVDKALYHNVDCSGPDAIIAYSKNDIYYLAIPNNYSQLKFKKLTNSYKSIVMVNVTSETCGAGYIAVGKTSNGKLYDLNTEAVFDKDIYYYYNSDFYLENKIDYIKTSREYKFNGLSGIAKIVIKSSETNHILGVIDSNDVAYDFWANTEKVGKVTSVSSKNGTITVTREDGSTYKFDYAELEY